MKLSDELQRPYQTFFSKGWLQTPYMSTSTWKLHPRIAKPSSANAAQAHQHVCFQHFIALQPTHTARVLIQIEQESVDALPPLARKKKKTLQVANADAEQLAIKGSTGQKQALKHGKKSSNINMGLCLLTKID